MRLPVMAGLWCFPKLPAGRDFAGAFLSLSRRVTAGYHVRRADPCAKGLARPFCFRERLCPMWEKAAEFWAVIYGVPPGEARSLAEKEGDRTEGYRTF